MRSVQPKQCHGNPTFLNTFRSAIVLPNACGCTDMCFETQLLNGYEPLPVQLPVPIRMLRNFMLLRAADRSYVRFPKLELLLYYRRSRYLIHLPAELCVW